MATIEPKTVTLKNGEEVCIRTQTEEDVGKILDYTRAIFQDDRFFMTTSEEAKKWQTVELTRQRAISSADAESEISLVAEVQGRIVSGSHISSSPKKRNQHVGQMGISILPEYRGIGLGTMIMQTMIDWAAAHPVIEKLALGVWADNEPAIRLYEKMGFVEEGRKVREVKYADGTYDDMVCMYRFVE